MYSPDEGKIESGMFDQQICKDEFLRDETGASNVYSGS